MDTDVLLRETLAVGRAQAEATMQLATEVQGTRTRVDELHDKVAELRGEIRAFAKGGAGKKVTPPAEAGILERMMARPGVQLAVQAILIALLVAAVQRLTGIDLSGVLGTPVSPAEVAAPPGDAAYTPAASAEVPS